MTTCQWEHPDGTPCGRPGKHTLEGVIYPGVTVTMRLCKRHGKPFVKVDGFAILGGYAQVRRAQ